MGCVLRSSELLAVSLGYHQYFQQLMESLLVPHGVGATPISGIFAYIDGYPDLPQQILSLKFR